MTEEHTLGRLTLWHQYSLVAHFQHIGRLFLSNACDCPCSFFRSLTHKQMNNVYREKNTHTSYNNFIKGLISENKITKPKDHRCRTKKHSNPKKDVRCFLHEHRPKNLSQFIDELLALIFSHFFSAYKLASRITNTVARGALLPLQARRFVYGSL
ncbi:hypothetical protein [Ktedonobacter racemifer]|uniref:Uncharacterized protein n=1 Tax=Ktedonobacter racemifer DSM 44963 TaxID=485913 RepID=D6TYY1_KTERA|nr:hypothetical protein [Ktedonobacter racemifer]EFH81771.1 hypothetical protein Krac_2518 [Ktedonobacter racemifer DSM 44963]